MELKQEKRIEHNYFNEKVMKWILENPGEQQFYDVTNTQGFGCSCVIESRYKHGNMIFYRIDEDGIESSYLDYIWRIDSDYLIEVIPDLTEEEKEELEDIEQVCVYYCPDCGSWALDGANI
jgi:hypothetical protein